MVIYQIKNMRSEEVQEKTKYCKLLEYTILIKDYFVEVASEMIKKSKK